MVLCASGRGCWAFSPHLFKNFIFIGAQLLCDVPFISTVQQSESARCIQIHISSVQLLSCVRLFVTPWTATHQASLSITNSQSLPKLMSIESVMASNHLILCHPLSSFPQSFPAVGSFPMSWLFASVGQSIGYTFPLFFWISFPFRSPQSTQQGSPSYTVGSHQLFILYTAVLLFSH